MEQCDNSYDREDLFKFYEDIRYSLQDASLSFENFENLYVLYCENEIRDRFNMYFDKFLDTIYLEWYQTFYKYELPRDENDSSSTDNDYSDDEEMEDCEVLTPPHN